MALVSGTDEVVVSIAKGAEAERKTTRRYKIVRVSLAKTVLEASGSKEPDELREWFDCAGSFEP
jgi:hypothetical protein